MKPYVICHMLSSLDGGLHPSRLTRSPDGEKAAWSRLYEDIHQKFDANAWIVGRVTMAEMSKAGSHAPAKPGKIKRPLHVAVQDAASFAIALDPSGKVHFSGPTIGGDHVIAVLGSSVPDSHLAELVADGVSYLVSTSPNIDLANMLEGLGREFGIRRLLLEGGAGINGSFLAAGLVDELSILIAPALDGRVAHQTFVEFGEAGLAGKVELVLNTCETLSHGIVHMRYAVTSA